MRIEFRGLKSAAAEEFQDHAERRLRFALGRFAHEIDRVSVHICDTNGPRGGLDKQCRVRARLIRGREVLVGDEDADWDVLIDRVSARLGRSVARVLEREREGSEPRRPWPGGGWYAARH